MLHTQRIVDLDSL